VQAKLTTAGDYLTLVFFSLLATGSPRQSLSAAHRPVRRIWVVHHDDSFRL
jgi:hypothetical protein